MRTFALQDDESAALVASERGLLRRNMTLTFEVVWRNGAFHPVETLPVSIPEGTLAKVVYEGEAKAQRKPFIEGLHAGMGWISDDFDDELPDSFWFGYDEEKKKHDSNS